MSYHDKDAVSLDEYLYAIRAAYLKTFAGDDPTHPWHPSDIAANITVLIDGVSEYLLALLNIRHMTPSQREAAMNDWLHHIEGRPE